MALLALLELAAVTAARSVSGEPLYDLVQSLFAIPTILTGVGLIAGGLGVLQAGTWKSAKRFLPLILGVYVFVALIPAIMGPHIVGRIDIGIRVLLLGHLGWLLWRGEEVEVDSVDASGTETVGQL